VGGEFGGLIAREDGVVLNVYVGSGRGMNYDDVGDGGGRNGHI